MTNEKMLEKIAEVAALLGKDEKKQFDEMVKSQIIEKNKYGSPVLALANLFLEVSDDVKKEEAKKSGSRNAFSAAKRVLKDAPRYGKGCLQYAYIEDDKQYFTDGIRCFVLDEHLPLPLLPAGEEYLNTKAFKYGKESYQTEMELPDYGALKAYVKTQKAQGNKKPLYCFGKDMPVVRADYLIDMLDIIKDAKVFCKNIGNRISPVVFEGTNGYGLLFPVNDKNVTERTAL